MDDGQPGERIANGICVQVRVMPYDPPKVSAGPESGLKSGPGSGSWGCGEQEQRLTFTLLKLLIFFGPGFQGSCRGGILRMDFVGYLGCTRVHYTEGTSQAEGRVLYLCHAGVEGYYARIERRSGHTVRPVWAKDLGATMMVLPIAVITREMIITTYSMVVLAMVMLLVVVLTMVALCVVATVAFAMVAVVVLTVVSAGARYAILVGPRIGMVGIGLSMMKRPSVVVDFKMMLTMLMDLTVMVRATIGVGILTVVRLTLVMEPTMMGNFAMVVRSTMVVGPPMVVRLPIMVVGITTVAGPIMMSPATMVVITMNSAMRRSQGKGCGVVGSTMMVGLTMVVGVAGVVGIARIVRGGIVMRVWIFTKVVRSTMMVGYAIMLGCAMMAGLVLMVGPTVMGGPIVMVGLTVVVGLTMVVGPHVMGGPMMMVDYALMVGPAMVVGPTVVVGLTIVVGPTVVMRPTMVVDSTMAWSVLWRW